MNKQNKRQYVRGSIEKRFWAKVNKSTEAECWNWTASTTTKGYGQMYGTKHRAHQVSWEIHNRKIKQGECVLHKCDNPLCVNPYHLFIGTQGDNIRDMWEKGRGYTSFGGIGEHSTRAKLTNKQAKDIRKKHNTGNYTYVDLAKEYDVSDSCISRIVRGITYHE